MMKTKLTILLGLLLMFSAFTSEKQVITIFTIGDSTMANKPLEGGNPERGWGQMLSRYFSEEIVIDNHAVNGPLGQGVGETEKRRLRVHSVRTQRREA